MSKLRRRQFVMHHRFFPTVNTLNIVTPTYIEIHPFPNQFIVYTYFVVGEAVGQCYVRTIEVKKVSDYFGRGI